MQVDVCDPRPGRLRYAASGALAVLVVLLLGARLVDYFSPEEFNVAPQDALELMDDDNARTQKNATTMVNAFVYEAVVRLKRKAESGDPGAQHACNGLEHIRRLLKD